MSKRTWSTATSSEPPKKKMKPSAVPKTLVDKSLDRRIKKLEKEQEVKYADVFIANVTIPNETGPTWLLYNLNSTTLGPAQNSQRVGTQCINQKLALRLAFQSQTLNIVDNRVRMVVFWFKNANTLAPNPSQLFDLAVITAPTYAPYNDQYADSFKVLYDKTFILKPLDWNGTTTTIGDRINLTKEIKLWNRRTRYNTGAGAGTYVDIIDNSLFIAFMTSSNSGAAGVNNPSVEFGSRCFYVDA